MFKIGDFSKLSRVSVKTLRYYDEIGLLKPDQVDRWTSYRYYSAAQLAHLNRILALKDLGLSLDQIGRVLNEGMTPAELRGMLRLKQAELHQHVVEEQARLDRVLARLQQIAQEEIMSTNEVVLKEVPAQRVAAIRAIVPNYGSQGPLWGELGAFLGQRHLRPTAPCLTVYYDEEYKESDVDIEVCECVDAPPGDYDRVEVRDLPAATMATLIHEGSYDNFSQSYGVIMSWIAQGGYRMVGPNREVYIRGTEHGVPPSEYITEIQIPVAKN